MYKKRVFTIIAVSMIIFALATSIYSFAATNTVPDTYQGEGAGTISGYVVSNVQYILDTANPSLLDEVRFTLDHPASIVEIKLVSTGSDYYSCSLNAGTWVCPTTAPQAQVIQADELRVIASQ